ncbi:MAG: ATP-grasp domain-containing protein [Candidatus Omnitrophica bacterium]|nr:ATP-grasp domain-containing protein [Candidatus Omnitrophota bacterium]
MSRRTVLVTGIGGDIGQSVLKCLREIPYDFLLAGCDIDAFAGGRTLVDAFYHAPKASEAEGYLAFIKTILAKEEVKYIFPVTEIEIDFFDKHRAYFEKDVTVFINTGDINEIFFDKYETAKFLGKHNIAYPATYLLGDYNDELSLPVIVKSRRGCGGRGMLIVCDRDELMFLKSKMKDGIVQELVGAEDDEYTVSIFSGGGKTYSIAFRRTLGYDGLSKVARLTTDNRITALVDSIVEATSLEGVLNVQCRKRNAEYVPFEINPRLSSTVYTRHYFGFQDVKWWMDTAEGKEVVYVPKFKDGVAVRTISEVFFDLESADSPDNIRTLR